MSESLGGERGAGEGERGGRGKGRDVSRNTATADYDIMAARGNQLWFIGLPVARCLVHLC